MSSAGDINGDGAAEILIGAPGSDALEDGLYYGVAYVLLSPTPDGMCIPEVI